MFGPVLVTSTYLSMDGFPSGPGGSETTVPSATFSPSRSTVVPSRVTLFTVFVGPDDTRLIPASVLVFAVMSETVLLLACRNSTPTRLSERLPRWIVLLWVPSSRMALSFTVPVVSTTVWPLFPFAPKRWIPIWFSMTVVSDTVESVTRSRKIPVFQSEATRFVTVTFVMVSGFSPV